MFIVDEGLNISIRIVGSGDCPSFQHGQPALKFRVAIHDLAHLLLLPLGMDSKIPLDLEIDDWRLREAGFGVFSHRRHGQAMNITNSIAWEETVLL